MERPPMETALSTDVVMDIVLSHLKVRDLLNCRKVSNFWNKAASAVLRRRSTAVRSIAEEKDLMKLEECIATSSGFPLAGLKFDESWRLKTAGTVKFLKKYGTRFTSLYLGTWPDTRPEEIAPFINHLPRLSILEVYAYGAPLYGPLLNSSAGQEDGTILNLPSLRTLRISSHFNEDILRQVCAAALPSLRIECRCVTKRVVQALKQAGKLQAVSVMKVFEDHLTAHELRAAELPSSELPTLTKLDFHAPGCLSLEGLKKLLISSQDTLKDLSLAEVWSSEFLAECPVLAKLTSLTLDNSKYSDKYVFQGRHGHKFPALKQLIIRITWVNPSKRCRSTDKLSDGLFIVPSVATINLGRNHVDKNQMEGLARSFPNVIEVQLNFQLSLLNLQGSRRSVDRDPTDIWSLGEFKFLEKLRIWDYPVKKPTKNWPKDNDRNMDSFLTGIPIGICQNLRKHEQLKLMDSPLNELFRDKPSILQLKNLKELVVFVSPRHPVGELPEEPPFISMVSVWYALEMMPNLQAKFMYGCRRSEDERRNKEIRMLKAAFKHVRSHVELEPFFY